jgi:type II secretory pathway component PulF
MARADQPLAVGLAELNHRSLGRIGQAAGLLSRRLEAGQSADVAIQEISGRFGPQAAAALRSMQLTGSVEPVAQLAETLRRQSYMRMQWIAGLIYPLITVLAAYLLLSTLMTSLVIEHWPSEIVGKKDSTQFIAFCVWLRKNFWLPPVAFIAIVSAIWLARHNGWFSGTPFGKSPNDLAWANFCNMLAVHVTANVPLADALPLAGYATGSRFVRHQARLASENDTSIASEMPPMIQWLLKNASQYSVSETAHQLRVLGDWYQHKALRRTQFWIRYVPVIITVFAGSSAAIIYCGILLPPLFEGLKQVVK